MESSDIPILVSRPQFDTATLAPGTAIRVSCARNTLRSRDELITGNAIIVKVSPLLLEWVIYSDEAKEMERTYAQIDDLVKECLKIEIMHVK